MAQGKVLLKHYLTVVFVFNTIKLILYAKAWGENLIKKRSQV